ncbi:MAG: YiiX/YebB-like N1pC/P60 family cysteine hydrolase [Beijerinckiaceae bacterium]
MNRMLESIGERMARFLSKPIRNYEPQTTNGPEMLRRTIRPGDVLLVEGNSRVSSAIKYLTQSTWSHAALCVGPIADRAEADGEAHILVEAELGLGVISSPLSRHAQAHTRICRPIALASEDLAKITDYATARIGHDYDVRNVVDLMRYLLPAPVPARLRRRMIALGSGEPTRAICSTLIAEAFGSVRYPILPRLELLAMDGIDESEARLLKEVHHIRHHSLYTPRDFDISPYFKIVKPTVRRGFDYRTMAWSTAHAQGG